jgi:hypothetical protein
LSGSSDTSIVLGVRYTSSVGKDILKVLFGLGKGESLDSFSSLVGVFIMDSEIFAGGLGD